MLVVTVARLLKVFLAYKFGRVGDALKRENGAKGRQTRGRRSSSGSLSFCSVLLFQTPCHSRLVRDYSVHCAACNWISPDTQRAGLLREYRGFCNKKQPLFVYKISLPLPLFLNVPINVNVVHVWMVILNTESKWNHPFYPKMLRIQQLVYNSECFNSEF